MAERKSVNKYYPPDWDPSKGSINKFVRGKAPRVGPKDPNHHSIRIIRFEMPYNIWCLSCDKHIGMGVRFNAKKKQIGMYFSTAIFSFKMKCPGCKEYFEIQTDPENSAYKIAYGAKRKTETWDPQDNETLILPTAEDKEKLHNNAFFKLEQSTQDFRKAKEAIPILTQLQKVNDKYWKDDYSHSQVMRKLFRDEKKVADKEKLNSEKIRNKNSLFIKLLPESQIDRIQAEGTEFGSMDHNMNSTLISSIFKTTKTSTKLNIKNKLLENTKMKLDPFINKDIRVWDIKSITNSAARPLVIPTESRNKQSTLQIDYNSDSP